MLHWQISFIYNFHQQDKFWNHLLNAMFNKAEQKSSLCVCLSRPGWENLHEKAGQKLIGLFFYSVPTVI